MKNGPSLVATLPHQPPALLVTVVSDHFDDGLVCRGCVPSGHPSVANGHAPMTMAVEFAAQASGLLFAIRTAERNGDEPVSRDGSLVSLNSVRFRAMSVPVEVTLTARVRFRAELGNLASFFFDVGVESGLVAEGTLGIAITGLGG